MPIAKCVLQRQQHLQDIQHTWSTPAVGIATLQSVTLRAPDFVFCQKDAKEKEQEKAVGPHAHSDTFHPSNLQSY